MDFMKSARNYTQPVALSSSMGPPGLDVTPARSTSQLPPSSPPREPPNTAKPVQHALSLLSGAAIAKKRLQPTTQEQEQITTPKPCVVQTKPVESKPTQWPRPVVQLPPSAAVVAKAVQDPAAASAAGLDSLIDLSSDYDSPKSSTKKPSTSFAGVLLDLDAFEDSEMWSSRKGKLSDYTMKQLDGLSFKLTDPATSSGDGRGREMIPQLLQGATALAEGMIGGLGECMSILQDKISDALNESEDPSNQPLRLSTPVNVFSGRGILSLRQLSSLPFGRMVY